MGVIKRENFHSAGSFLKELAMRHRPLRVSYQLGRVVTPEGLVVVVVAQRPVRDHRVKP